MTRSLYDEDGIDGPFERAMDEAIRDDAATGLCRASLHPANGGPAIATCTRSKGHDGDHGNEWRTWRRA